jgi:hypothetical protein
MEDQQAQLRELLYKIQINPKNPRKINKKKEDQLYNSIKEFPKMLELRPIVYDEQPMSLGGNMRLMTLRKLVEKENFQLKPEYFKSVNDFTPEEKERFIIVDNVPFGDWDWDILKAEWDANKLQSWGLDANWSLSSDYNQKLGEVIYEPKDSSHPIAELFQADHRFDEDIEKVEDPQLKELFKARVSYFGNFDYSKIADYYAYQATPEQQRIFEKLALVLLDKDKLIENGFSKIMWDVSKDKTAPPDNDQ